MQGKYRSGNGHTIVIHSFFHLCDLSGLSEQFFWKKFICWIVFPSFYLNWISTSRISEILPVLIGIYAFRHMHESILFSDFNIKKQFLIRSNKGYTEWHRVCSQSDTEKLFCLSILYTGYSKCLTTEWPPNEIRLATNSSIPCFYNRKANNHKPC